jgi:ADP-heptose:LPS heptosyltransferase
VAVATDSRPRITVLRALGLGDLLTAVPALRALARAYPEHRRLLAAPAWLEPLLPLIEEDGEPCLDGLVDVAGLEAEPGRMPRRPDLSVNLHGCGPESHRLVLASRPARLIAFRNAAVAETRSMPAWQPDEHEVERWCRLLRESGVEADPARLEIRRPDMEPPDWAGGVTLLHPGAASRSRRWPPERWSALARAELAAGRQVLVTGSAAELPTARWIAAAAGVDPRRQLAGRTDLVRLAGLVAGAGAVVCGDTGVAHLATALAVPSVLLFGPTSPRHWGPPGDRPLHRVLWRGRSGDPHGAEVDPGLLEIDVDSVLSELDSVRPLTPA